MVNNLCTTQFMRVCIANLLFFISLYMLFPVIPLEMTDRLSISIADTGSLFLLLTAGMFVVGPFSAYIIDAYKRKNVCIISSLAMLGCTIGYFFVQTYPQLMILCAVQGLFVGMGTISGVTLAIDITHTNMRSYGNLTFSWMVRMGMFVGIALGVWIYQWYSFQLLLYASVAFGLLGILFLSRVYVPFRAPIVTCMCSTDRFFLVRGWIPAINLIIIALVPGLVIPIFHHYTYGIVIADIELPYYTFVMIGFPFALILYRLFFKNDKSFVAISIGLALMFLSMLFQQFSLGVYSPILLGIGMGLVAPEFLLVFVKLSHHCQRGTANTTHFLSWSLGIASGIALACYLQHNNQGNSIVSYAIIASVVALIFFLAVTYPYFKSKRVR